MPDGMFFTNDMRSLRRGKRVAQRTSTCRPCLVWPERAATTVYHGVVMDMSPFGFRIRMMDELPIGLRIEVQLMRDEDFTVPLAAPILAEVVREVPSEEGFLDYGVRRIVEKIKPIVRVRPASPSAVVRRQGRQRRAGAFDEIVNDWERQRKGRG